MSSSTYTNVPGIVQIDGAKIKEIREQQGLTQLYVATAVGVTTDTISRWENKKYPTIKKDNGEKLAAALEVELEDILDTIEQDKQQEIPPAPPISKEVQQPTQPPFSLPSSTPFLKRWGRILSLFGILVVILLLGLYFFGFNKTNSSSLQGIRHVPPHYIPGLPLPVVIEVASDHPEVVSFVVKENSPVHAAIVRTSPPVPLDRIRNGTVKWLNKNQKDTTFMYTLKSQKGSEAEQMVFDGTISIGEKLTIPISGKRVSIPSVHHWADTDKDNVISDQEILSAYDLYQGVPGIDFDFVEEIWMASGYKWDRSTMAIQLIQ